MRKQQKRITEEIEFPDFDKIIMHCKTLMSLKFPQYKNSWKYTDYEFQQHAFTMDNEWWQKRLKQEVKEFLEAKSVEDARKELADIINVCAMIMNNVNTHLILIGDME